MIKHKHNEGVLNAFERLNLIKPVGSHILNEYTVYYSQKYSTTVSCICGSKLRDMSEYAQYILMRLMPEGGNIRYSAYKVEYLDWLLKESPFSSYYTEESFEEAVALGGIAIRTDVPSNLMMNALQMIRYVWEFPEMVDNWAELVKAGLSPSDAFVCTHFISRSGEVTTSGIGNDNHFVFDPVRFQIGALGLFESLEPEYREDAYRSTGTYEGIQITWVIGGGGSLYEHLNKHCKWEVRKVKHAFGESKIKVNGSIYEQIAAAIKLLKEE
jgi:hypothetical protein